MGCNNYRGKECWTHRLWNQQGSQRKLQMTGLFHHVTVEVCFFKPATHAKDIHVVQDDAESIACSLRRDGSSMAAWLQHWCQFRHGHSTPSPVFKYLESSSAGRPSALEKFHVVWVVRGLGLYGYVIFHKFPLRRFQRRAQLRWQQASRKPTASDGTGVGIFLK